MEKLLAKAKEYANEQLMPLKVTKDKYKKKFIAWHLESDKIAKIKNEEVSKIFWKFTSAFYLLGVGSTEERAISDLKDKIICFAVWLWTNHKELNLEEISSNLPEYRQAIYEYNTNKTFFGNFGKNA